MDNGKQTFPRISIEAQLLYDRLKGMAINDRLSYDDLSKIIGRPILNCRWALDTARRRCLNAHSIVIECVPGWGIQRLDNAAIIGGMLRSTQSIHRKARIASDKARGIVDRESMDESMRTRETTALALLGAIKQFTTTKTQQRLAISITNGGMPQLGDVLQVFAEKK